MESTPAPLRAILPLGKARVVERSAKSFKIALGGSTTMTIVLNTDMYDIRDGDLLTLYTEVYLNANPSPASKQ